MYDQGQISVKAESNVLVRAAQRGLAEIRSALLHHTGASVDTTAGNVTPSLGASLNSVSPPRESLSSRENPVPLRAVRDPVHQCGAKLVPAPAAARTFSRSPPAPRDARAWTVRPQPKALAVKARTPPAFGARARSAVQLPDRARASPSPMKLRVEAPFPQMSSFDGEWGRPGLYCSIKGQTLIWGNSAVSFLTLLGPKHCRLHSHDGSHLGELVSGLHGAGECLLWSDGDVWHRLGRALRPQSRSRGIFVSRSPSPLVMAQSSGARRWMASPTRIVRADRSESPVSASVRRH